MVIEVLAGVALLIWFFATVWWCVLPKKTKPVGNGKSDAA